MLLLDLPDELLGLVLEATEMPAGIRLASKRFASMPRGKAKVRELQRWVMRKFGILNCHRPGGWVRSEAAYRTICDHLLYNLNHLTGSRFYWTCCAFFSFSPIEAAKVRDHLVAQRLLLHGELIEACRAWFMELGQDADELDVDELQEYVENQWEVPAGSLSRAKKLLEQAVHKVVQRLNEDALRKSLFSMDDQRDPGNFLTGPDETWWLLTGSDE